MDDTKETVLQGGNINHVVKIGDTVRRPAGSWTPMTQALLTHIRSRGFVEAPEPLGLDDQGREVMRYIRGASTNWSPDSDVAEVGRLIRRYHDAVADFVPPVGAAFRFREGLPTEGEIVCHHDIASWNVVRREGAITGLVDWDTAGPGRPEADLAYAAWRYAFLSPDEQWHGPDLPRPVDREKRLALIVDAYGLGDKAREGFFDTVDAMMVDHLEMFRRNAPLHSSFGRMWNEGIDDYVAANRAWVAANRARLAAALG